MADKTPNIFPAMSFADPDAALEWLSRAFGFHEGAVHRDDQGAIRHAETYGSREYSARDLDGHTWSFGTYQPEPAA